MLRLHAGDVIPAQLAAWQARPGLAEALDVAYGVPWLQHAKGIKPAKAKKIAWAAIIDRHHTQAAAARHTGLAGHAARLDQLGLASHAQALRDATDPAQAPATARAAADACAAALAPVSAAEALLDALLAEQAADSVRQALSPYTYLAGQLRTWADCAELAHAGRRRP